MAVRGLSRRQAEAGHQPPRLIKAEWKALHEASLKAEREAICRTARQMMALRRPHAYRDGRTPTPSGCDD